MALETELIFTLGVVAGILISIILGTMIEWLVSYEKEKSKYLKGLNNEEYRRYMEFRRKID